MNDLVFLDPNRLDAVPFTTSDVIAEFAGVSYRSIQRLIDSHESDFSEFGRVRFEITPSQTKGGVQNKKIYHLNEEQATLLMTYLKNTERVRAFKKELVRQFYAMRRELVSRQVNRAKMLPTRRDLTDAIRDCIPESPHKGMWYKHYTDLAYRAAFGMSAAQLRKARNAPKGSVAADYLTSEEMESVERITKQVGVLVEMRLDYQQIKRMLLQQRLAAS
jgi:hypothetical protein